MQKVLLCMYRGTNPAQHNNKPPYVLLSKFYFIRKLSFQKIKPRHLVVHPVLNIYHTVRWAPEGLHRSEDPYELGPLLDPRTEIKKRQREIESFAEGWKSNPPVYVISQNLF